MKNKRVVIASLVLAAALLGLIAPHLVKSNKGSSSTTFSSSPRLALIVDGLYESYPNDTLIDVLKGILESHGFTVHVVKGRSAGPELFKSITKYSVIVLRVHGGYMVSGSGRIIGGLFTGAPWSTKYLSWAREGLVAEGVPVYPPLRGPKVFVALLPKFFETYLSGRFPPGAVMIAGGCYTALDKHLVSAMCGRGLWAYIGFSNTIKLSDLDALLPRILDLSLSMREGGQLGKISSLYPGLKVYICGKR